MKQRLHCQAAPASGWKDRAGRFLGTADLLCVYWTASGLPRQCALRGEKKWGAWGRRCYMAPRDGGRVAGFNFSPRSEEHTSELQSRFDLVCRLLLEKKKK